MLKVGYIGLGLMGKSIARNILKAGFPLVVHNRSRAAVDELVAEGAVAAFSPAEVACCLPYLKQQIGLIQPRLMLAVGRIAAQNLLATDTPIGKLRGSVHAFGEQHTPLIVTYHPAYLLRLGEGAAAETARFAADLAMVAQQVSCPKPR